MLQPKTISQAMGLARLQEETIEFLTKKNKAPSNPIPYKPDESINQAKEALPTVLEVEEGEEVFEELKQDLSVELTLEGFQISERENGSAKAQLQLMKVNSDESMGDAEGPKVGQMFKNKTTPCSFRYHSPSWCHLPDWQLDHNLFHGEGEVPICFKIPCDSFLFVNVEQICKDIRSSKWDPGGLSLPIEFSLVGLNKPPNSFSGIFVSPSTMIVERVLNVYHEMDPWDSAYKVFDEITTLSPRAQTMVVFSINACVPFAGTVFDKMPNRSFTSGNHKIVGYASRRQLREALCLYHFEGKWMLGRTLIGKIFGSIGSVRGGPAVSKESPLVHIGACIASLLGQGGSTKYHLSSRWLQFFNNDWDQRDLVTFGCATGVAAAFRAPVGRIFFALEVTSWWRSQLLWRVFFTSAIVAVVVRTTMGWWKSGKCGHFGSSGFIIWDIAGGQEDYLFKELLPMAIIGVIRGLLGALYNQLIRYITYWRRKYLHKKGNWFKIIEAGDSLIQLYHNVISDFETKINFLKLAHFAVISSQQYAAKEATISFLAGVIEKLRATREMRIEEAILHIMMQIAIFFFPVGLASFLSSARSLSSLRLSDNHLGQNFAKMVFSTLMDAESSISVLDLSEDNISGWLSHFRWKSASCPQTSSGIGNSLQSLRLLNLRGNNLHKDDDVCLKNALVHMPKLKILDISDNPLEDDGIMTLIPYFVEMSGKHSPFKDLKVERCGLSCDAVSQLLSILSTLTEPLTLSIGRNDLGSKVGVPLGKFLGTGIQALDIEDIELGPCYPYALS